MINLEKPSLAWTLLFSAQLTHICAEANYTEVYALNYN